MCFFLNFFWTFFSSLTFLVVFAVSIRWKCHKRSHGRWKETQEGITQKRHIRSVRSREEGTGRNKSHKTKHCVLPHYFSVSGKNNIPWQRIMSVRMPTPVPQASCKMLPGGWNSIVRTMFSVYPASRGKLMRYKKVWSQASVYSDSFSIDAIEVMLRS